MGFADDGLQGRPARLDTATEKPLPKKPQGGSRSTGTTPKVGRGGVSNQPLASPGSAGSPRSLFRMKLCSSTPTASELSFVPGFENLSCDAAPFGR